VPDEKQEVIKTCEPSELKEVECAQTSREFQDACSTEWQDLTKRD